MTDKRVEDLLVKKSFVLWIKEECTPLEKEQWDSWLGEHSDHQMLVEEAQEIITAVYNMCETADPEGELNELNRIIDRYEEKGTQSQDHNYYKWLYSRSRRPIAAGILLLVVLLSSIFVYWNYPFESGKQEIGEVTPVQEYSTNYGEKLTFRLSDGSRIVLNANSELRFSSKIEKGLNAEVWLEGEAYFNVTPLEGDQKRTFTVHTDDGSIQVLGTRFAVNTFGEETETVLEEGRIRIRVKDESPDKDDEYVLETNEIARFTAYDKKIAICEVNPLIYTAWTEDKLFFENTPMDEVAQRIQDTFGMEVVVDEKFLDETISGSIKCDNLDVLTEALARILDTTIKKQDQKLFVGINTSR